MTKKRINLIIGVVIILLTISVACIYMIHRNEDYDYLRSEVFQDTSALSYIDMVKMLSLEVGDKYITESGICVELRKKQLVESEFVPSKDYPSFATPYNNSMFNIEGYGIIKLNDEDLVKVNSGEYQSLLVEREDKYEYLFLTDSNDLSNSEGGVFKVTAIINDKQQYNTNTYNYSIVEKN